MITIEDVSKTYRKSSKPAVKDLSLELKDGEIVGFAGLNGAGKSTTIRMISGILFPDKGNILVNGHDIVEDKIEASKNIGWVPELPIYELNATPASLLKYYAGFFGKDVSEILKRGEELSKRLGIWEHRDKKLRYYSQGMKKRFSIVAASQANPRNYLFDETLNGLDPEGVRDVRDFMLNLKKSGKCILLSSHILSELEIAADRVAIIRDGELIKIIGRDEISKLGYRSARMTIDNMDDGAVKLLEKYGPIHIDKNAVTVGNITVDASQYYEINAELISEGYRVSYFEIKGEDLESYFLDLVESHT